MMGTILPRRFEPIRVLRKGSASSTFLATDQQLARNEVVVKVIGKGNLTSDTASLFDIFSWYRGLRHPHVSEILDAGFTPKRDVFYVRNHLPDSQFFHSNDRESARSIASAIDFLQSVGRVHGAIKPSNVFASAGVLQLADPWIGRTFTNSKQLAEEDIRFSAPEVLSGNAPSLESDLYSLGALLYRFFSGRDPFEDSDAEFLKEKYLWASPRSLSSVCHVSRSMAGIVAQLLDKDPSRRRPAFESLKNELEIEAVPASRAPAVGLTPKVDEVLESVASHRGLRVAIVEGPAGSGKSRLVEELSSRVPLGDRSLVVCETKGREPYLTLTRNLICLADQYDISAGPSCMKRLQQFVDQAQEPTSKSDVGSINQDLGTIFAAIARQLRLVVVIEDIDRTSRRLTSLLQNLGRQVEDADLSVVVTTRPASSQGKGAGSLRECLTQNPAEFVVGSLTDAESALLTSFLSKDAVHRGHAERNAGGHPAFLEEFCKSRSTTAVPKPVRQVLSGLIAGLPTPIRHVAEVLSIFQEPTPLDVITTVSALERDALEIAISKLVSAGLVDPERLTIRYPAACALLDANMSKARRTELHARAFQCLQALNCKESILADHAFHGGLIDVAHKLYRELGDESFTHKDYIQAGRYYGLVADCRSKDPQLPTIGASSSINLAICHFLQGNRVKGQAILRNLRDTKEVRDNPEVLSEMYATFALTTVEESARERVRLLMLAIGCLSEGSPKMVRRYLALTTAQLGLGNLEEAELTLKKAESYCSTAEDQQHVEAVRASVFMMRGDFADAARIFSSGQPSWAVPGSILVNLAYCLEQLGDLGRALDLQKTAVREAEASGHLLSQMVSLSNVGALETKLGNMTAAEAIFAAVRGKFRELQRRGEVRVGRFTSPLADMAFFSIQKGNYRNALVDLGKIDIHRGGPFLLELFLAGLTRCELYLELGQLKRVRAALNDIESLARGRFAQIDMLLVEERLLNPSWELCARLEHAIDTCERLGSIYQNTKVRIALARHFVILGDLSKARSFAETARGMAIQNGYRPLAARALLLMALSAQEDEERERALTGSLNEAAEIELVPLVAECAFQLGLSRYSRGDWGNARDYLSRYLSITASLAEDLNATDRKTYLAKPRHQEARRLFNEASTKSASMSARPPELVNVEGALFGRLYRLNASMMAALDLESAISVLLQTLKETFSHPLILVLRSGSKPSYNPLRTTVTEEVRKRIASIAAAASDKPYLAGIGTPRNQETIVWVPITSLALTGGIYLESLPGIMRLNERDIEFLTVVAAVSTAAFDHVCRKPGLAKVISSPNVFGIEGSSRRIEEVRRRIQAAAGNTASVLIEGESGTGKELVAKAIHQQSSRSKAPFIAIDCGALPDGLIEAELFGAKKGSYTGAVSDREGLFEAAHRGTIFLDEISNLGMAAQAKLLRVLQEREVRKIGSMAGRTIDVRLIAATNCNLEGLVREGRFRQDLLYRLKVLQILLPPLREREADIPILATYFLKRLNASNQTEKYFGPRVLEKFMTHSFPGNVRELQNAVERAFYMAATPAIVDVDFFHEHRSVDSTRHEEIERWFKDLTEGREDFWTSVYDKYKRRDISRERVVALVDFGLRRTKGSYKTMASMFQIEKRQYHRFMDFLRRSHCLLDFRPYRNSD